VSVLAPGIAKVLSKQRKRGFYLRELNESYRATPTADKLQTNSGAAGRKFELEAEPGQIGLNVAVPVSVPPILQLKTF
jgi:hypothetical protein